MNELKKSRLMLILSMVIFGTIGLFVRSIPMPSAGLALCRAVLAVVFILICMLSTGRKIQLRGLGRSLPLLLLSGAAIGVNWILLFEAYRYTSVSVATLSYYFAPVIVIIACPILFRERLTAKQLICFCCATVGLVLIIGVTGLGGEGQMTGILFGLGAAVFYATVILLNKTIKMVEGLSRTLLQLTAAAVVLTPYVLCTDSLNFSALNTGGVISLLTVGIVHTGVAYCLYFSALRSMPGQEAAILSYTDPLLAVVLSVVILGEPLSFPQILGGVLLLGFTVFNEISIPKK